jgi:FkbM family methyltransferase
MRIPQKLNLVAKNILYKTGVRPYSFGQNLHEDIRLHLPNFRMKIVFDVGANEGQSARTFLDKYPNASIVCFEPNRELAQRLTASGVRCYAIAMGDCVGTTNFDRSLGTSDRFFVTDKPTNEAVPIDTIDHFCEQQAIAHIDYLKIDTEGHDLHVIRGADAMLAEQRIGLAQAEVSMSAENDFHASFFEVHKAMQFKGYRLFGIYEQFLEWTIDMPYLRRANVVYISRAVATANLRGSRGARSSS